MDANENPSTNATSGEITSTGGELARVVGKDHLIGMDAVAHTDDVVRDEDAVIFDDVVGTDDVVGSDDVVGTKNVVSTDEVIGMEDFVGADGTGADDCRRSRGGITGTADGSASKSKRGSEACMGSPPCKSYARPTALSFLRTLLDRRTLLESRGRLRGPISRAGRRPAASC
jgi:hypothetical protein